ncbi:MAG TPA: CBS domain-containing protein [Alphaproteobacteria bacterium]
MKVRDVMSRDVNVANPDETIRQAAMMMARIDAGILPVGDNDRMVGMISDRDIAIRAVGQGKGPDTKIREIMTAEVKYCYDDEDVSHVCENMAELQIRRLPVVNREKRLVGIISIGDIARHQSAKKTGEALEGISQPGGQHSQTAGQTREPAMGH